MTEAEWHESAKPVEMMQFLKADAPGNARRFRLFGCACAWRVWGVLKKRRHAKSNRELIEAAERFADGLASAKEMLAALRAGKSATCCSTANRNVYLAAVHAAHFAARDAADQAAEQAAQAALVRDIFGNPFSRRPKVNKAWRTDTAIALARRMYESRDFGAMPILADARRGVRQRRRAEPLPRSRGARSRLLGGGPCAGKGVRRSAGSKRSDRV